jgi:NTP pyrophosphatase (non-canonical NTP hydrolase)
MNTFNEYEQFALNTSLYPKAISPKAIREILDDRHCYETPKQLVFVIEQFLNTPDGNILYPAMGCAGEAGEYLDKVKKHWRNTGDPTAASLSSEQRKEFLKELGDQLWYIAASARELSSSLEEVANINVEKLTDRRARGVTKGEGDNR